MKKSRSIKKAFAKAALATLVVTQLAGCMGSMGLTQQVADFNVKVTDNKFGRSGLYILMYPVYSVTTFSDLLVFNSIEFWSGTNPITDSPAMIDVPYERLIEQKEVAKNAVTAHEKQRAAK